MRNIFPTLGTRNAAFTILWLAHIRKTINLVGGLSLKWMEAQLLFWTEISLRLLHFPMTRPRRRKMLVGGNYLES